jgi:hypothetical protein
VETRPTFFLLGLEAQAAEQGLIQFRTSFDGTTTNTTPSVFFHLANRQFPYKNAYGGVGLCWTDGLWKESHTVSCTDENQIK